MEKRSLICIECPRGCELSITFENGAVEEVKGNFCAKGKTYAKNECTKPLRVVTTTLRLLSGEMLPVKTDRGVLKSEIMAVMAKINKVKAKKPIKIDDILKENIDNAGANLVSTKEIL